MVGVLNNDLAGASVAMERNSTEGDGALAEKTAVDLGKVAAGQERGELVEAAVVLQLRDVHTGCVAAAVASDPGWVFVGLNMESEGAHGLLSRLVFLPAFVLLLGGCHAGVPVVVGVT
jgi:hypothetical protein